MKGINKLLMLSATVWLLASCSQESATMRTIVNTDGSCEREIWTSPNLSKEGEAETENVFVIDSTWTVGWSYRGDTVIHHEPLTAARYDSIRQDLQRQQINKQVRDTVVSHAHRHFASVEEMAQASPFRLDGKPLCPTIKLEKRFRWFYTYYYYTETYPSQASMFSQPITNFMSEREAQFWFCGQPDLTAGESGAEAKGRLDELEERVGRWLNANLMYDACEAIVRHYDVVPSNSVSKTQFLALRDSLVRQASEAKFPIDEEMMMTLLRNTFHTDAFSPLLADSAIVGREMEQKTNSYLQLLMLKADYEVVMPGRIISGNAFSAEGSSSHFRLTGERLIPGDFTLEVVSRDRHLWAFLLTALIVVLAIASYFWHGRRSA